MWRPFQDAEIPGQELPTMLLIEAPIGGGSTCTQVAVSAGNGADSPLGGVDREKLSPF